MGFITKNRPYNYIQGQGHLGHMTPRDARYQKGVIFCQNHYISSNKGVMAKIGFSL